MAIAKYSKICGKNQAGNAAIYFTEATNISSLTITGGEITAVTMASGKAFHVFEADIDTVKFTSEGKGKTSYSESYKLELKASKKTKELLTAKDALADAIFCGVACIRQDNNGNCWLSGYNPNTPERHYNEIAVNFDSGAALTEEGNAYTITLSGVGIADEIPFDSTLAAQIVAGTATFITY